jgi:hypothetical protein
MRRYIGRRLALEGIEGVVGEQGAGLGIARHIHVKIIIHVERLI